MKNKPAPVLTAEQDREYGEEFGYYLRNVRADTKRADRYAWRQVCIKWPELKKQTGSP